MTPPTTQKKHPDNPGGRASKQGGGLTICIQEEDNNLRRGRRWVDRHQNKTCNPASGVAPPAGDFGSMKVTGVNVRAAFYLFTEDNSRKAAANNQDFNDLH